MKKVISLDDERELRDVDENTRVFITNVVYDFIDEKKLSQAVELCRYSDGSQPGFELDLATVSEVLSVVILDQIPSLDFARKEDNDFVYSAVSRRVRFLFWKEAEQE